MSGGLVVVGADLCGCPPGKLPSPELVRHFLRLPPRTHGFAGVTLPFCGRSSRPDMHAFSHKKTICTITILSDGADRFLLLRLFGTSHIVKQLKSECAVERLFGNLFEPKRIDIPDAV